MATATTTATLAPDSVLVGTIHVSGNVFRAIPHSATNPLDSSFSFRDGGRWNAPGSFPVLYTGSSVAVVRAFVDWSATYYGLPLATRPADDLPDIAIIGFRSAVADACTDQGLAHHGLPSTYPKGYPPQDHSETRPVGQHIFDAGFAGVAARSATMSDWSGPAAKWADVAIFTTQAPDPILIETIAFSDWYVTDGQASEADRLNDKPATD